MTMLKIQWAVEELAVQTLSGELTGPPLLKMLREAVGSNSGRTKGGASSPERILIDTGAFSLFEDIGGQIASQFTTATDIRANRAPEVNLLAWAVVFSAARYRGDVTDLMIEVATERVESWVTRIRDYFDRPVVKEIIAPCPRCGQRYLFTPEGDTVIRTAALNATIQPGKDLQIDCGSCHAQWVGDQAVIQLGGILGMPLDVDGIREARAS